MGTPTLRGVESDAGSGRSMEWGVMNTHGGLVHAVMFYRDRDEYLGAAVPFVRDGLHDGDRVLVAVPGDNLILLRDALVDDAAAVELSDMAEMGKNPARTFVATRATVDTHAGGRVRFFAEPIWAGRDPDTYPACVQNEALWNSAFADDSVITLCPYNSAELPDDVIADARSTHPLVWRDGALVPSADYADTDAIAKYNEPLPIDQGAVMSTLHRIDDLREARSFTARVADDVGLSPERAMDLQLIVSELATNSLKYTAGECLLGFWRKGGSLVCQVSDGGRLEDPLAGRRLPDTLATSGRGLFLVNALADLVRMHTSDTGTTVRVYMNIS